MHSFRQRSDLLISAPSSRFPRSSLCAFACARVAGKRVEIGFKRFGPLRPVQKRAAVTGNDAFGRKALELIEHRQPAEQAPIKRRGMFGKDKITGKKDTACRIENRQIIAGMGGRPSPE